MVVELPADGQVNVVAHFTEMELQLYVPNAFSPNNDGLNDAFRPLGQAFGAQDYLFQVFNRWGEVVFSSTNPDEGWLGQDQRNDGLHYVKDGTYAWSVRRPLDPWELPRGLQWYVDGGPLIQQRPQPFFLSYKPVLLAVEQHVECGE